MARVVAVLLGYDHLPGTTVTRYCSSSPADHPDGVPRDQGRRGRRVHLGRRRDGVAVRQRQLRRAARTPRTRVFADAQARTGEPRRGRRRRLARPARGRRSCPTSTSRWARPPRTSPSSRASPARSMDEFGVRSQNLAEKAIADGFWAAGDHAGHAARRHRRSRPTTARAPASPSRASPGSSRSSAPTDGHRRQLLPAQRRRRRRGHHERHQGRASSASPRWPGSSSTGVTAPVPRDHGPRPGRGVAAGAGPRRHDASTTSTSSRSTRRSPRRSSRPTSDLGHRPGQAQRQRRRDRRRAPVRHDRRPDHRHPDQLAAAATTSSSAWRPCASAAARAWR